MTDSAHTTIATWVMPILSALEPYRDSLSILEEVGIDAKCIEDANQRISIDKMKRLWLLAEDLSGDDCIGLEAIKYVNPTSFHALVYAHQASSYLRESLERMIKFSSVVSTAVKLEVIDENDEVIIRWHLAKGIDEPSHHALDAFMAMLVKSGHKGKGEGEKPKFINSVKLNRPPPKDEARFAMIFNCPLTFDNDINEMRISRSFVDKKLATGNPELVRINEKVMAEYISRFNKNDIVASVYNALIELMPNGEPTREKVASALGTSSRNLHRKLSGLNTSYKAILDDTRKRLAMQYIRQSDISITTITYELGFLDSSSFSRSFKRWTGKSPSEYRNH